MKKYILIVTAFFIGLSAYAQEVVNEEAASDEWSLLTKQVLLVLFAILCIFFAARTFRGKPDA